MARFVQQSDAQDKMTVRGACRNIVSSSNICQRQTIMAGTTWCLLETDIESLADHLRFVPASCISFPGTAEIVPEDDPEGRAAFQSSRILRMNLEEASRMEQTVFIKIRPRRRMHCYGVGFGLMELRRDSAGAGYSVEIPADRL